MPNQTAQQYKQVQVKTANQGKLLLMLYQGCVKFLRLAKKNIEENDLEAANNNIIRAQDIIDELRITLDREKGGELAENLFLLYDFMKRKLVEANINKDIKQIEIVENLIVELLDSWEQVVNAKNRSKKSKLNVKG